MLKRVEINNFALIENAVFIPGQHLTVISGETGAGKSLLIDALGSLTGKRANRDIVRTGSDYARVEAVFDIPPDLIEQDLFQEISVDEQLILSREIYADGGSQARINGRLVNISLLREISENLIGLHAQHEQQAIFNLNEQRALLDRYVGREMSDLLEQWDFLREKRKELAKRLREYGLNPAERTRQLELIRYQINEILAADLKPDEEKKLLQRNKILSTLTRMKQDLTLSRELLSADSEHGAASLIAQAAGYLDYSANYSEKVEQYQSQLKYLSAEISDLAIALTDIYKELEAEPNEVEQINRRLDLIDKLKLKYGDSVEDVLVFLENSQRKLNTLLKSEELFEQCRDDLLNNEKKLTEIGNSIHDLRKNTAEYLSQEICSALNKLAMPNVQFSVKVDLLQKNEKGYYGKFGRDHVEFLIRTNPGESLMPLSKIASGGEVSRILLAIKSILGQNEQLSVLIFDEIDSGVSGITAISVAEMLREIASDKQVLCVSHMAQVAAASDTHFLIEKIVQDQKTRTMLLKLDQKGKVAEVARLLSGKPEDDSALNLAQEMIARYIPR